MSDNEVQTGGQRHYLLQGGCNFRDLGGYPTRDGRATRWGMLFRSAVLTYLTPADHRQLASLKVHTICDLRRADEIALEPTRWATEVCVESWSIDADVARAQQSKDWESHSEEAAAIATMREAYRSMPKWLQPQLRGLFQCLRAGSSPILFHCAAGKDRTGFIAAMLLHALGVPRSVIFEDTS